MAGNEQVGPAAGSGAMAGGVSVTAGDKVHADPAERFKGLLVDEKYSHRGYTFHAQQSRMLDTTAIDAKGKEAGINPQPDMLFDTFLEIKGPGGESVVSINTVDIMKGCRVKERGELKLAEVRCHHAESWCKSREKDFQNLNEETDWTYSTTYFPPAYGQDKDADGTPIQRVGTPTRKSELPTSYLTDQADPILWYETLLFWEDELDDTGMSKVDLKIRVQGRFWFVLLRNETRVDKVLVRRLDSRLFGVFEELPNCELKPGQVYREWSYTEASWEKLMKRGDLIEGHYELVQQTPSMLKPQDLKALAKKVFDPPKNV